VVNHRIVEDVAALARQGLGQVTEAELDRLERWHRPRTRTALEPPISCVPSCMGQWALAGGLPWYGIAAYRLPCSRGHTLHYVVEGAWQRLKHHRTSARACFLRRVQPAIEPSPRSSVLGTTAQAPSGRHDGAIDVCHGTLLALEAGPFSILVKGTAFRLGFDAARALNLHMKTGVVDVAVPARSRLDSAAGESLELFANRRAKPPSLLRSGHAEAPRPEIPTTLSSSTLLNQPECGKHAAPGSPGRLAMHDGALAGHSIRADRQGRLSRIVQDAEGAVWTSPWSRSARTLITLGCGPLHQEVRNRIASLWPAAARRQRSAKDAAFFLDASPKWPASSDPPDLV